MNNERFIPMVHRGDWSFERRAERDEERHKKKIEEVIRENLDQVVSDGSIITADPESKRTVRIPQRSLELPNFRFGNPGKGIGTGDGNGEPQPGDPVPGDGSDQGPGAEGGAGNEFYEAEFTIEEIQQMVFEDLGLPNIKPKGEKNINDWEANFNDVRKKRTVTNIDLGRTVLENLLRNARETGVARIGRISPDDYRVRTWEYEEKPRDSAVVMAMADISASMGQKEKYITRAFCWWAVSFLRTKYPNVDVVFIAHDTEAYEVNEEQFFTRGQGGATRCSSANEMAADMMRSKYQPSDYNIYPLHFSDGDNLMSDNDRCVQVIQQMLDDDIAQYAFIEIGKTITSRLFDTYEENISDDRFKAIRIADKDGVLDALKQVFTVEDTHR